MNSTAIPVIHDVIGVGFGPSNIALAIALEELSEIHGRALDTLFLDKQRDYTWHGETLVNQSRIQISFLKDLVSLRNPTSAYSFINYLHKQERLVDFINRGTFNPCRMEFNDYLRWVANHFTDLVNYSETVIRIEPEYQGHLIEHVKLIARDHRNQEKIYRARNVVVATGGTPRIPEAFIALRSEPHLFHHSEYLSGLQRLTQLQDQPTRIAIIGGGQSAAEAFIDLNDRIPTATIDLITRASALRPADDSPFVNEIFAPAYTDFIFSQNVEERDKLVGEFQNTNYAAIDLDLIQQIYDVLYRQKVARQSRHAVRCRQQIESASKHNDGFHLVLRDIASGQTQDRRYDAIVLATGYDRNPHNNLLKPMLELLRDGKVDRNYRVTGNHALKAGIYLQGFCESTHGLSDTLLSVLPMRAEEIGKAIYRTVEIPSERQQNRREVFMQLSDA